ncbi:MAG: GNAT family N-acetyltransferase [Candidatus Marinimicrobia bacterium]|nr:GNAT family N-acetyltransferase [Candidatus Neomarinimicrobiota bacterium]MBT3631987.1 GNAT family N-acetyltransferase [Candidatus Neomarinimicrobiota bacterium]MBT3824573.1 GNAT family N-acetyltransferase [Candidatus Neomarinimicrobiota bacterium]MBT4130252.1 GNAT family N-acetyltransferase [Candidatus Neomarinimicrobiota bacterium]MBT4297003.1 GNAT family N-acetyltransferase [Candidatus Neomarinimicrobiota bacterium]
MKDSLHDLLDNVDVDPVQQETALVQYFKDFEVQPPQDLETWSNNLLKYADHILGTGSQRSLTFLLEQGWNPAFTSLIKACNIQNEWFQLEMELVRKLKYTPGHLFNRKAAQLGNKTLFNFKRGRQWQQQSWSAVQQSANHLAAALIDLMGSTSPRIAILSENRLEVAITDIACLTYGFVNVPIQPAAPPAQVEYILAHAEIEGIFISDSQHLRSIESILPKLPAIKHIITYNSVATTNPMVKSYKRLIDEGGSAEALDWLEGIRLSVSLSNIASIMYTSGTTGYPKGIVFTYENIISKRFARSLALNLGTEDRFLCFLPLFHTFGRFLEMWGSIFWGAEYTFSSGKGIQSLLSDLKAIKPTVLISIPKRWQDIYDTIGASVDLVNDESSNISKGVKEVTGGALRWGLSAAGYLPPEIFRFFQAYDLHLHSGYGMTEATGGITMTPTDGYIENSVGIPLPGMEIKLVEDGELWIRGAYVSGSYWNPTEPDERPDGWFTTGDIFQSLDNGQIEIIDRKKEIYKNAKGQTIAPQKIENMFRDFESIHQLFIVGDHMPYNTALVRLNKKHKDLKSIWSDRQKVRDYVGNVIHSVNSFLAPFERIVDFRQVDRDFKKDLGELTEKGTFKRSAILEHFKSTVESLYERPYKSFFMEGLEIQIPNWVFLQRGWTQNDLVIKDRILKHRNKRHSLRIEPGENEIRIGALFYQFEGNILQFEDFIRQPAYCLGNRELEEFLDYAHLRIKPVNKRPDLLPGTWVDLEITDEDKQQAEAEVEKALNHSDYSIEALKPVILLVYSQSLHPSQAAFRLLNRIYSNSSESIRHIVRYAFLRLIRSDDLVQAQFAVEQVVALFPANDLERIVTYALGRKVLFNINSGNSSWSNINIHKVKLASNYLKWLSYQESRTEESSILFENVLGVLFSWSKIFPQYYSTIRSAMISSIVNLPAKGKITQQILNSYEALNDSFSQSMQEMDPDTTKIHHEQTLDWEDVLLFDKPVPAKHRKRISSAFINTSILNESIYLFFEGKQLSLRSIPPQGIWINLLGSAHGKTVYRVTIQSIEGRYKFVLNLNDELSSEQIYTELFWLMACEVDNQFNQLVETLGSYKPQQDLWSEEFISGLTVREYLKQAVWAGSSDEMPAPEHIWPHFVWTAVLTYTSFWKRTRFKKMISDPSPGKIVVPIHDYHVGGRLVSISGITEVSSGLEFMENLESLFVRATEKEFPTFMLKVGTEIVYHAIREALGQKHSIDFFKGILADKKITSARRKDLLRFLDSVEDDGYQPNSVYFAIRRYHRWLSINQGATLNAKAHFLKDLYRDYNIQDSEPEYPDARVQLFLNTVFSDTDAKLKEYLTLLGRNLRQLSLDGGTLQSEISQYIGSNEMDEYSSFFLKRLAFPELPPSEDIELIATRSTAMDEIEIMISRHDSKGTAFRIRRAMHPKEIIQLQQHFVKARMDVNFTHEHKFLVALNKKNRVIGGLFYLDQGEDVVYMDKVVVSDNHRGGGVSRGLLNEFVNRMRNSKKKMITTGFLHPGYFYKFGFTIEKDQGGLVKYL